MQWLEGLKTFRHLKDLDHELEHFDLPCYFGKYSVDIFLPMYTLNTKKLKRIDMVFHLRVLDAM